MQQAGRSKLHIYEITTVIEPPIYLMKESLHSYQQLMPVDQRAVLLLLLLRIDGMEGSDHSNNDEDSA